MFNLIIQTNSPGEVSSWVIPFIKKFKSIKPDSQVIIYLTPCQWSTGQEQRNLEKQPEISKVYSSQETIKKIFSFPLKFKNEPKKGAVICLGGDPNYSKILGFKYKYPVYVYTEHKFTRMLFVKKVFNKKIFGDLMAEKFNQTKPDIKKLEQKYHLQKDQFCLFFTGSRPQHFIKLTKIMANTVKIIKKYHSDFQAVLNISPFISSQILQELKSESDLSSFKIIHASSLDLLPLAKMLVTIPGTNTSEAMYLGVPHLVLIPLNDPSVLIFPGIAGYISKIPFIGKLFRILIIFILKRLNLNYALPNIIAHKKIVPEIAEILKPEKLAQDIINLYQDNHKLSQIKANLQSIQIKQDTASKIIKEIIQNA